MENIKNEFMLARLAMAVDCEGSIMIGKYSNKGNEPRYYVRVALYNTNERFIDWLVSSFGFSKTTPNRRERPEYKPVHMAYTTSNKAEEIMWGIKPYLLIKEELADITLELQSTLSRQGLWVSDEIRFRREELYQYAKELNKRGI